jgi:hypothetical protein
MWMRRFPVLNRREVNWSEGIFGLDIGEGSDVSAGHADIVKQLEAEAQLETGLRRGPLPSMLPAGMKTMFPMGMAALAAALMAGCASSSKVLYHAGDEAPPDFLAGPAGVLLTNVEGFSARLTVSLPGAGGGRRTVTGDMLGREGVLVFQPANAAKAKRARTEGGMFFIWNETTRSGFVLNDPLQAYAPIAASVQPTNVALDTSGAAEEEANGHPCRRIQAVVQCSDGTSTRLTLWEAEDAKHFPVRIRTAAGPREMTLDFSELRLELPAAPIFSPPEGFTKYDTAAALIRELIVRQTALGKGYGGRPAEAPESDATLGNWRPGVAQ